MFRNASHSSRKHKLARANLRKMCCPHPFVRFTNTIVENFVRFVERRVVFGDVHRHTPAGSTVVLWGPLITQCVSYPGRDRQRGWPCGRTFTSWFFGRVMACGCPHNHGL
eukprot:6763371-Pyramimonas_sp.AAC.1